MPDRKPTFAPALRAPTGHTPARHSGERPAPSVADVIVDRSLRQIYDRLLTGLRVLHHDVAVTENALEARAEYAGRSLCRLVPYREVIHVQIGESPQWESRIRDSAGFHSAMDRLVKTFLEMASSTGRERPLTG